MKFAILSLIGGGAALAACAEYNPEAPTVAAVVPAMAPGDCFRSTDIRNHTVGDSSTLYIDVAGRGAYRVGMAGACLAGTDSNDTLVITQTPASGLICAPIDLDVALSRSGVATHCIPQAITRMSVAEVDALPPRLRP